MLAGLGLVAVLGTGACGPGEKKVSQPTPTGSNISLGISCDSFAGRQTYKGTVAVILMYGSLPNQEQTYTVVKVSDNKVIDHSKRTVVLNDRGVFLKAPGFRTGTATMSGPMPGGQIGMFKNSTGDVQAYKGEKLPDLSKDKPVAGVHLDPSLCPENS